MAATLVLFILTMIAVVLGLNDVRRQADTIQRVLALQAADEAAVMRFAQDPGDAAYYTFQVVFDPPSPLAFAATGQRDIAPAVLRIRALALEGQLYESEITNPVISLLGAFDFVFVLLYLAPLVLIVLLHDLRSHENEAGRLQLLAAMPHARSRLWLPRIITRVGLVLAALLLPLGAGLIVSGADMGDTLTAVAIVIGITGFWTFLCTLVAKRPWRSVTHAATLAAGWFLLTLVIPAAINLGVNQWVPVPSGADIVRANREAVHDGWDIPKEITMSAFFEVYPQWQDNTPIRTPFHWKWYFAFQHLGDLQVADDAAAYRSAIEQRDRLAARLAWLSPPVAMQILLLRSAGTDIAAQLRFQDRIRDYHRQLREFYYPALFHERTFTPADFAKAPRFEPGE